MHRNPLPLALVMAFVCAALPALAQQAPPRQVNKRVWTTQDVTALRFQGLISIVGPEQLPAPTTPPAPGVTAEMPAPVPVYSSATQDPAWYAEQAARLQTVLDAQKTALSQAQDNLEAALSLRATSGINLGEVGPGFTPQQGVGILQQEMQDTQQQLDALADLARRNDIQPGVLRTAEL
jgi:hypothetical protein